MLKCKGKNHTWKREWKKNKYEDCFEWGHSSCIFLQLDAMQCSAVPYRTVQCNAFCFGKTTWCEFRWFSLLCRCTKDEHQPNPPVSRFFEHFYANKNATKYAEWTKTKAPELCVYVLKEKENRQEEIERKKTQHKHIHTSLPPFNGMRIATIT